MFGDFGLMTIWSGTLSVDTFFLLSGFLMSYLTLKDLGNRPLSGIKIPFADGAELMLRTRNIILSLQIPCHGARERRGES